MAGLWAEMTRKHGLKKFAFDQLVSWPFADYVFSADWDVMSDVTKSRQHGFHDVVDSEAMFEVLREVPLPKRRPAAALA